MIESFLALFDDLSSQNCTNFSLLNPNIKADHELHLFKSLCIRHVLKEVDGIECSFLSIEDIDIHSHYRSNKILTRLLDMLESKGIPILVDDIINHRSLIIDYSNICLIEAIEISSMTLVMAGSDLCISWSNK